MNSRVQDHLLTGCYILGRALPTLFLLLLATLGVLLLFGLARSILWVVHHVRIV